ncbi:hypothetical protein BCR44DRAFT_174615 [Catenaria anguillulae PL171]|uniref:Uncharacterized protein n=1 Tax=Catenaria anguillulae PL171 TaxID=765915 RepID=A0A1Y2H764_9FUNG|nr:hypothetical protein BCR44DRAFT_174615 [Catenaria anguillulae PL171]
MARQQRTSLDFLIVLTASFFLFILVLFRFLSAHRPLLFFSFACLIPVNLSFPPFWFFFFFFWTAALWLLAVGLMLTFTCLCSRCRLFSSKWSPVPLCTLVKTWIFFAVGFRTSRLQCMGGLAFKDSHPDPCLSQ